MNIRWRQMIVVLIILPVFFSCRKSKSTFGGLPSGIPDRPRTDTIDVLPDPLLVRHRQQPVHKDIGKNIGGFYEALPPGYDSSTIEYPLLVFLHGGGELGNGVSDLRLVLKHAVPKMLHEKTFPPSFEVDDSLFSFIVISPQFKEKPRPPDVDAIMQYARKEYRVNPHRVYLAGLSMGGGATWTYAADYGKSLAAIVPICGASWSDTADARRIARAGVPVWAFHNQDDRAVPVRSTTRYIEFMIIENPAIPPRLTLWPTGGHDAWTKATDPAYKEDNKNIYEWMLQYVR